MKPHPRIRKTIKWGGAALTVLLVVVWIASRWFWLGYVAPNGRVEIGYGQLRVTHLSLPNKWWPGEKLGPYWKHAEVDDFWLRFWCDSSTLTQDGGIPLWAPAMCSLCLTTAAWRLDTLARQRARLNLCPKCNYDRAGIAAEAKCPECGAMPSPAPDRKPAEPAAHA